LPAPGQAVTAVPPPPRLAVKAGTGRLEKRMDCTPQRAVKSRDPGRGGIRRRPPVAFGGASPARRQSIPGLFPQGRFRPWPRPHVTDRPGEGPLRPGQPGRRVFRAPRRSGKRHRKPESAVETGGPAPAGRGSACKPGAAGVALRPGRHGGQAPSEPLTPRGPGRLAPPRLQSGGRRIPAAGGAS
jgi:hypothetical protein